MELISTFCNRALAIPEQSTVKACLIQIKLNENFDSTRFWGKIFGIKQDYLIIEATTITHQIKHKYFFSIDGGLNFAQLPIVEPWMEEKCMNIARPFTGTTSHIYPDQKILSADNKDNIDDGDKRDDNDDDVDNEKNDDKENIDNNLGDNPPPIEYKLTELDRLAWSISKINDECMITPKGSVLLTSKKIIQKNLNFSGLSRNDATQLKSYLHWRTPKDPYAVSKYRKATAMNDTDFLDPITNDLPNGCWRLRSRKCGLEVSIRNLLWHGYEFKYEAGQSTFIQAYFGNGVRQNDLVFLI